jgi:predicted DNA-binding transcriptional regulator YafY
MERIFGIDRMLRGKRAPTKRQFLEKLEIGEATLKRDLQYMRDRLHAPVEYVRGVGYRYEPNNQFALPGMWFSADEVQALLLMLHLLDQMEPSLLRDEMQPFADRLRELAKIAPEGSDSISDRIAMIPNPVRAVNPDHLQLCIQATLSRRRLRIKYHSRGREEVAERDVSPQRLIYYRSNWYLDAWCHSRDATRRFAVDAILTVGLLHESAQAATPAGDGSGYGIFSEPARREAVLLFNASSARWIEKETWHPEQQSKSLPDGSLELRVPYGNSQEILMDILRHGPNVEVIAPTELREQILRYLSDAVANYRPERRPVEAESLPMTHVAAI